MNNYMPYFFVFWFWSLSIIAVFLIGFMCRKQVAKIIHYLDHEGEPSKDT
jgi:hypothetical protein